MTCVWCVVFDTIRQIRPSDKNMSLMYNKYFVNLVTDYESFTIYTNNLFIKYQVIIVY